MGCSDRGSGKVWVRSQHHAGCCLQPPKGSEHHQRKESHKTISKLAVLRMGLLFLAGVSPRPSSPLSPCSLLVLPRCPLSIPTPGAAPSPRAPSSPLCLSFNPRSSCCNEISSLGSAGGQGSPDPAPCRLQLLVPDLPPQISPCRQREQILPFTENEISVSLHSEPRERLQKGTPWAGPTLALSLFDLSQNHSQGCSVKLKR